ncbi:MAG: metalloregulator ArsR/SmtB family transcription factor [Proteobacteria bacterium]|nr:metalloregulator ArsR/SmtB family transcription factor [Pseudomonadota bacterium]
MTKGKAEKELDEYEAVFFALAHEARRRILVVLLGRGGKMTAGEIVERFSCSWPTMTRHLQTLEAAGLIGVEKLGRERHYVLNSRHMHKVIGHWLKWFEFEEEKS